MVGWSCDMESQNTCPACKGASSFHYRDCERCRNTGIVPNAFGTKSICPACRGKRTIQVPADCVVCGSTGYIKQEFGIVKVFEAILEIAKSKTVSLNETGSVLKNAVDRTVYFEFAPDPDIIIREEIAPASFAEK